MCSSIPRRFTSENLHSAVCLISEAVRGEGAKLINNKGETFMTRYDPRADLAPRDIVTRAIMEEMLKTGEEHVFLDAHNYVKQDIKERFPTIYENCLKVGVDITREPIPVVPAAHYFCGGVMVDNRGRTTLDRLYGAGECTCSGIHGANRLASVSLLEGVLWGLSSAEDIIARQNKSAPSDQATDGIHSRLGTPGVRIQRRSGIDCPGLGIA